MRGGSLLVVGIVQFFVLCVAVIGFVTVRALESRGVLGFCGPATLCPKGSICARPEYYAPVYGFPDLEVYSNSCFASICGAWMWIIAQSEQRRLRLLTN